MKAGAIPCILGVLIRKYRGFLLDADNTLFDYDSAEREALEETFHDAAPRVPLAHALEVYRPINTGWWKRFESAEVSLADLKVGRFVDVLAALGVPGDARRTATAYLERLSRKASLLPGALSALSALRKAGPLCLVTNGISLVQRGRLAVSGIAEMFAAVLISEEVGIGKPDPRFFAAACSALGLPPAELLCIGDNPRADVDGARAAGIDACWYNPARAPWPGPGEPPAFVIDDLLLLVKIAEGVYP